MNDETLPLAQSEEARLGLAAQIISAYVSNNPVPKSDLPELIASVRAAIGGSTAGAVHAPEAKVEKASASEIKKSITPDALISFIDGKRYKTLKRHLGKHGLTPEQYRTRFGLAVDYPMVSPNYSQARAELARGIGLGQRSVKQAA